MSDEKLANLGRRLALTAWAEQGDFSETILMPTSRASAPTIRDLKMEIEIKEYRRTSSSLARQLLSWGINFTANGRYDGFWRKPPLNHATGISSFVPNFAVSVALQVDRTPMNERRKLGE